LLTFVCQRAGYVPQPSRAYLGVDWDGPFAAVSLSDFQHLNLLDHIDEQVKRLDAGPSDQFELRPKYLGIIQLKGADNKPLARPQDLSMLPYFGNIEPVTSGLVAEIEARWPQGKLWLAEHFVQQGDQWLVFELPPVAASASSALPELAGA
jgi:hypothetical protein